MAKLVLGVLAAVVIAVMIAAGTGSGKWSSKSGAAQGNSVQRQATIAEMCGLYEGTQSTTATAAAFPDLPAEEVIGLWVGVVRGLSDGPAIVAVRIALGEDGEYFLEGELPAQLRPDYAMQRVWQSGTSLRLETADGGRTFEGSLFSQFCFRGLLRRGSDSVMVDLLRLEGARTSAEYLAAASASNHGTETNRATSSRL